jgi:hypothetical protein
VWSISYHIVFLLIMSLIIETRSQWLKKYIGLSINLERGTIYIRYVDLASIAVLEWTVEQVRNGSLTVGSDGEKITNCSNTL